MNPARFFAELRRRNVSKVAIGYGVVGWLVIQVAATIVPALHLPDSLTTAVVVLTLLGFPIALVIAWAFEMTPEGMKRTEDVPPHEKNPQWSGRKFVAFVLVVGLLATGLFIWQTVHSRARQSLAAAGKSIAVLPFENLSRDPDNAYFAEGIQDEILTRLAKIGELKVISRTSTQRYKSSPDDLPRIAQQLGVAHILEGSVQKSGDQVRVTVQLIQAATDSHLWAERYDRKLTDIFAVESEIAENIARSLQARLTGAEKEAVSAKPTENPEAYEAYLRGLTLWNTLQTSPQEGENTVLYFKRATELDPNFAVAWAYRSAMQSYIYGDHDRTPHHLTAAKEALDVALRLKPEASETQFALGLYRYRGLKDYEGALQAFQEVRLSEARVSAIEFSAYVKRRQGKWEEALELHRQSVELAPRDPIILSEAALTYRALRRFDEALALVDRALEIEPSSPLLFAQKGEICLAMGEIEKALPLIGKVPLDAQEPENFLTRIRFWTFLRQYDEAIRACRNASDPALKVPKTLLASYRAWLGISESLAGDPTAPNDLRAAGAELRAMRNERDETPRILRDAFLTAGFLRDKSTVDRLAAEAQELIRADAVDGPGIEEAMTIARAHLGETDAAIAGVQRLLQTQGENSLTPALLRIDPLWDPLRSDPRFEKLSHP
ncbi:MAG: tetratricopeptide repeat protein [Verrucomicrobiota bacterium]|nr:tetratricopeptide repeat protein [Verrucomicrobiota bacterium]